MIDCHTHPLAHTGGKYTLDRLRPFVAEAVRKGLKGLAFTDHEWYKDEIDPGAVEELRQEYPQVKILLGLEIDYEPGREEEIRRIIEAKPYDYVIGSVHDIGGWPFDHPDYLSGYRQWKINSLYEKYFATLAQAVDSGLFQLVGHLDLIKVFGYFYQGDLLPVVKPVLEKIRQQGMAVELNTNGFYKPVREMYPSPSILRQCLALDIPVVLSSDAHAAHEVGRDFARGRRILQEIGYQKISWIEGRKILSRSW
ncbi:MAG TPA: histidinol-phosphatase HisJ family protein [Clostridia bacterium]|nr:histidinol-phosphatase HisJ family protein [Clostridia bacterium]